MNRFEHSLLGEIGDAMLADIGRLANGVSPQKLRNRYTSAEMAVMRDIATLQTKAIQTFGQPPHSGNDETPMAWAVTRHGLQQSTHHSVAAWKASWFDANSVTDVCCGLGSDLLALARRGPAIGIDVSTDVLAMTGANLRICGQADQLSAIDVVQKPIESFIAPDSFLHVDPDRRIDGTRHTRPEDLVPDWDRVHAMLSSCRGGAVKLAPATTIADAVANEIHRTWITASGGVREQTILSGEMLDCAWMRDHGCQPGGRSAVNIRDGVASVFASAAATSTRLAPSKKIESFLVDFDPAIRAAQLTEAFAEATSIRAIDLASGFLTTDSLESLQSWKPLVTTAKVLEVVGCDDRKLRRSFRARDAYAEVIKVRGADQNPVTLSKRLKDCGSRPLGLWIGRNGKRTFAAITDLGERHHPSFCR